MRRVVDVWIEIINRKLDEQVIFPTREQREEMRKE